MNLSYAWLKELVDFDWPAETLAEKLTFAGLTVDEIQPLAGGDFLLVSEPTTNRPDWLCHQGVAREIAALAGTATRFPAIDPKAAGPDVTTLTSVTVEDNAKTFCPRYTARVIRGVTIQPSPDWLRRRLEAIGQRSINNVVDITNLVCFEMNQPLHAFDYDWLKGNRIVVRMARAGEPFTAITGEVGTLSPERLVIADAERAVALAGVKGGANSEVSAQTKNLLLESAYFNPAQVRRSGRTMKMASESSYRFERGIDPGGVERASARAAQLILELAGGELASGVIDTAPDLGQPWEAAMRFARCAAILGVEIPADEIAGIFERLGLAVAHRDREAIRVKVPGFRADVTREIDLIEEIARLAGYHRIPDQVSLSNIMASEPPMRRVMKTAREVLVGLGYHECVGDAFVPEAARTFAPRDDVELFTIQNPVNAERPKMRPSLVPSLLEARRVNRLERDVRLFEINAVYYKEKGVKCEFPTLALLDDRGAEYARGAFEAVVKALKTGQEIAVVFPDEMPAAPKAADGCEPPIYTALAEGYAADASALLTLDCKPAARFGVVAPAETARYDVRQAPAALEVDLRPLAAAREQLRSYVPLPRFPAVRRDLAVVVPEATRWRAIEKLARGDGDGALEDARLESVFRGGDVPAGQKSVALALTYRAADRSLTDAEANTFRDAALQRLLGGIPGAALRQA